MIADKYIIDSLHQDIKVNVTSKDPPLIRSELLSSLFVAARETHLESLAVRGSVFVGRIGSLLSFRLDRLQGNQRYP